MKTLPLRLLFGFGALVSTARLAGAAEVLTNANLDPNQLRFGSVNIYSENDKYFSGTDQYYTNGAKISFLSTDLNSFTADPVPQPVQKLARTLGGLVPPGHDVKLGLAIGQNLYTPPNIHTTAPQPLDRPYAAWLYGSVAFEVYQPPRFFANGERAIDRLDTLEVTFGMVGPGALGKQAQNNVHHLIGVLPADGWPTQIHNEPGMNFAFERKYRFSTTDSRHGWGADFIPHAGFSLGNIFTFANAGFEIRGGWHLPADFGTNLIRPSGDSNSEVRPPFSVFLFGEVDGRAVARDITLDGNSFRSSARVTKNPLVGDMLAGFAIGTRHWQVNYTQAVRSREFTLQKKADNFGSISMTFYY